MLTGKKIAQAQTLPSGPALDLSPETKAAAEKVINGVLNHIEDRIRYLMMARSISWEHASRIIMREIEQEK